MKQTPGYSGGRWDTKRSATRATGKRRKKKRKKRLVG